MTAATPVALGSAQVLREGTDLTLIACGPMAYQALVAAAALSGSGIKGEVIEPNWYEF